MGWSGYILRISVRVDAHGGEREEKGEALYEEFMRKLDELCTDPKYNQDEYISVMF